MASVKVTLEDETPRSRSRQSYRDGEANDSDGFDGFDAQTPTKRQRRLSVDERSQNGYIDNHSRYIKRDANNNHFSDNNDNIKKQVSNNSANGQFYLEKVSTQFEGSDDSQQQRGRREEENDKRSTTDQNLKRKTTGLSEMEKLFDPHTRTIPMHAFFDPIDVGVHQYILREQSRSVWAKLRDIEAPFSSETGDTMAPSSNNNSPPNFEDISKNERPIQTRHTVISIAGSDFRKVTQLYDDTKEERKHFASATTGLSSGAKAAHASSSPSSHSHQTSFNKDASTPFSTSTKSHNSNGAADGSLDQTSSPHSSPHHHHHRSSSRDSKSNNPSQSSSSSSNRIDASSSPISSSLSKPSLTVHRIVSGLRKHCVIDEVIGKAKQRPIILVPSGLTALINNTNILTFLQVGKFVDSSKSPAARSSRSDASPLSSTPSAGDVPQDGSPNSSSVPSPGSTSASTNTTQGNNNNNNNNINNVVTRQIRNKLVKFRIVESAKAMKFDPIDWTAVVCVIVAGPEWQFKGWPFGSIEDIFKMYKGFFFAYTEVKVPPRMHQWKVQVMRLSRTQRHYDGPMQNEFWRLMEDYLLATRESLNSRSKKIP